MIVFHTAWDMMKEVRGNEESIKDAATAVETHKS